MLQSMILILVPNLINIISMVDLGSGNNKKYVVKEHHNILNAIERQNPDEAGAALAEHLNEIMEIRNTIWQIE